MFCWTLLAISMSKQWGTLGTLGATWKQPAHHIWSDGPDRCGLTGRAQTNTWEIQKKIVHFCPKIHINQPFTSHITQKHSRSKHKITTKHNSWNHGPCIVSSFWGWCSSPRPCRILVEWVCRHQKVPANNWTEHLSNTHRIHVCYIW